MGPIEFVGFAAFSLAVGSYSIDVMLPALQAIGNDMRADTAHAGEAAIAAFLLGVGSAQLVFGPLSDRYGRKPIFVCGLLIFIVASLATACAADFTTLLAARLMQGVGAGGQRVVVFSIVRDRNCGIALARVLSLVVTFLLFEPLLAPMLGQAILLVGSWRMIAATVVAAGCTLFVWTLLRLEESLPKAARHSVSLASLGAAYRMVLSNRSVVSAMLVLGLMSGAHLGFLVSSQSIFQQTFGSGLRYTLWLALVSCAMAFAALVNVRLVRRHGGAALVGACLRAMLLINALALGASAVGALNFGCFLAIQSCNMFAFGLLLPNLTAMTMDPFGHIAGTASSLYGFLVASIGALLAFAVGHFFDGTVRPLFAAYVVLSAVSMLLIALARRASAR